MTEIADFLDVDDPDTRIPADASLYVYVLKDGTAGIGVAFADETGLPDLAMYADPRHALIEAVSWGVRYGCRTEIMPSARLHVTAARDLAAQLPGDQRAVAALPVLDQCVDQLALS